MQELDNGHANPKFFEKSDYQTKENLEMKKYVQILLIMAAVVILAGWALVSRGLEPIEAARPEGLTDESFNPYGSTAWVRGNPSKVEKAEVARLSGLAGEFINPYGSTAWVHGNPSEVGKAEAARLSGLAGEFINPYGSTAWMSGDPSEAGIAEAGQSDLNSNHHISEPDYPLDGKLFQDAFGLTLESRISNDVPDYPLDGRIFNEFFLEGTPNQKDVDYPDFPLDGKFFIDNY